MVAASRSRPTVRWLAPWILALVFGVTAIVVLMLPRASSAPAAPALAGTVFPDSPAAPNFHLRDQWGHLVSLQQFRGHPVILTFQDSLCTQLCPVVAETIHRSLAELGPEGKNVAVLAISVDPEGDTPASVRKYSMTHGLYHRWHYLTASRRQLKPVWTSYYLYVAPANAPAKVRNSHTSANFLIDARGRERVLMGGDPSTQNLEHDLQMLSGYPPRPIGADSVPAPQVDHPAPAFAVNTLAGRHVDLRSLRGKVVVLNFWASWCHPCRQEAPRLSAWYRTMQQRGVVVLGVDQQEGSSPAAAFAQRYHLSYPIGLDPSGDVGASYDVAGLPETVVIDQHGTVTAVQQGEIDARFLSRHVTPLLGAATT